MFTHPPPLPFPFRVRPAPLTIAAVKRSRIEMPKDYLGHKNIQHAVRYTEPAPDRFKNFWRD